MDTQDSIPIRVGVIALTDLSDPNPISGMPYRMAQALRSQGIETIEIPAIAPRSDADGILQRLIVRIQSIHKRRIPMWIKRTGDNLMPRRTRNAVLKRARSLTATAQQGLQAKIDQGEQIDALFGCCISTALYDFETDLPVVYFSDATSPILQATYPLLSERGDSFRKALHDVEHESLRHTTVAVFAAPSTQHSAICDFGIAEERTRVVPMGAQVYPSDPDSVIAPGDAPSRESCELLIVAADPIRKRVDLATEATEIVRQRGINATLHVIGKGTNNSNSSSAVDSVGLLRLSNSEDRVVHQELLRACHLQLLPSLGEAFGIAPSESAHFARPSVVANAGGLPFVVLDGDTGIVMAVDADASAWADAIESLVDDPKRYQAMSIRALQRAREELNWDAWGASLKSIIQEQINGE